jgi:Domain of unknown function (DUF4349)
MKTHSFFVAILVGLAVGLLPACGHQSPKGFGLEKAIDEQLPQTEPTFQALPEISGSGGEKAEAPDVTPRQVGDDFKLVRQSPSDTATAAKIPAQIIKNAEVRFQVADHKKATIEIGILVKKFQGYLSEAKESNNGYQTESNISIRVPSKNFDLLLTELLKIGSYTNFSNVTAQDVTEQYVDIVARLRTKREVERRYVELLRQAKNVSEVLEVEAQLRVIREEIESAQGRLKYLQDQVAYSTIALHYYQPNDSYRPEPKPSFLGRLGDALGNGWAGLLDFMVGLTSIWPFLLIILGLGWLLRRWWKSRKK